MSIFKAYREIGVAVTNSFARHIAFHHFLASPKSSRRFTLVEQLWMVVFGGARPSAPGQSFWYYRSLQLGDPSLSMIGGWVALSGYGPGLFH
jgi:hypothetical protein